MTETGKLSSIFASPAGVAVLAALAVLLFYLGITDAAVPVFVFMLLFGTALFWKLRALKHLSAAASADCTAVFLGERITLSCTAENRKLLPLIWLELLFPLGASPPIVPERPEDLKPLAVDGRNGTAEVPAACGRVSWLLWFQSADLEIPMKAARRGILTVSIVTAASGDGFGLGVSKKRFPLETPLEFCVYPGLLPVSADILLKNITDTESGRGGYLDDVTLLRMTRAYQPGDPAKALNWRELAGKGRLETNLYETIFPRLITFLFDAPSFGHPEEKDNTIEGPRMEWVCEDDAFEDALSLTASCVLSLSSRSASCGLILPGSEGRDGAARKESVLLFPGREESADLSILYALAAFSYDGTPARFPFEALFSAGPQAGTICVITESAARMTIPEELLARCGRAVVIARNASEKDAQLSLPLVLRSRLVTGEEDDPVTGEEGDPAAEEEDIPVMRKEGK